MLPALARKDEDARLWSRVVIGYLPVPHPLAPTLTLSRPAPVTYVSVVLGVILLWGAVIFVMGRAQARALAVPDGHVKSTHFELVRDIPGPARGEVLASDEEGGVGSGE